jgi:hypothetical protein
MLSAPRHAEAAKLRAAVLNILTACNKEDEKQQAKRKIDDDVVGSSAKSMNCAIGTSIPVTFAYCVGCPFRPASLLFMFTGPCSEAATTTPDDPRRKTLMTTSRTH